MLKGLRPPTHRADAPGVFIFPHDTAWDRDRIEAEQRELVELALAQAKAEAVDAAARQAGVKADQLDADARTTAEASAVLTVDEVDAAKATHPVARYLAGQTRFQIDAPDQGPRGPARASDYLKPSARPTQFILRRVSGPERALIELDRNPGALFVRYIQASVARISVGGEDIWTAQGPGDRLGAEWVDALCDSEGGAAINLLELFVACRAFSQPLTEAEGKR